VSQSNCTLCKPHGVRYLEQHFSKQNIYDQLIMTSHDEEARNEAAPLLQNNEERSVSERPTNDWWAELSLITRYTVPLVATYLLQYSFSVITTTAAGHLSPDDLAAAAIGDTTMNIAGLALYEGMATALDTLCAQAYGAGN
jgi:MATE family multidrug resistance protein